MRWCSAPGWNQKQKGLLKPLKTKNYRQNLTKYQHCCFGEHTEKTIEHLWFCCSIQALNSAIGWNCRKRRQHLCSGVRLPPSPPHWNMCPGHDTKSSDDESRVLELCSTSSLTLLPGQFWPGVVIPVMIASVGQIKTFNHLIYLNQFNSVLTNDCQIELFLWYSKAWNHCVLKLSTSSFKTVTYKVFIYRPYIFNWYIYKQTSALNSLRSFICRKIQPTKQLKSKRVLK